MIHVSGLRVDYADGPAVCGVDLTVPPGTVLGVIGPRNAGKTTLLRAIAGLAQVSEGQITLSRGVPGPSADEPTATLGYMPAWPALYPELRVWECLDVLAADWSVPKHTRRDRIHEVIDTVGLGEKWNLTVRDLYARDRMLLAFGYAILQQPDVLLLDEPGMAADGMNCKTLGRLIRAEADRGAAVVLTNEALAPWETVFDDVLMLEGGEVVSGSMP